MLLKPLMDEVLPCKQEKSVRFRTGAPNNGRWRWCAAETYKLGRLARWAGTGGIVTLVYYQNKLAIVQWIEQGPPKT